LIEALEMGSAAKSILFLTGTLKLRSDKELLL